MNASFMPVRDQPHGRWSLWDMINFHFGSTIEFVERLEVQRLRFKEINMHNEGALQLNNSDGRSLQAAIEGAEIVLKDFDDKHIRYALDKLRKSVGYAKNNAQIYADICALSQAIKVCFEQILLYSYPPSKGDVFRVWRAEWEIVYKTFPETIEDIWHGVDCWAMGHDTASVFHMMRVLESGLAWLGKDVGVVVGVDTWHIILDQIEKRIRESGNTLPRGEEKSARLQFLSEAAKEFRYFKDGWRNYVSHARGVYDEHQARSVMDHVKSFMLTLAKAPKEKPLA